MDKVRHLLGHHHHHHHHHHHNDDDSDDRDVRPVRSTPISSSRHIDDQDTICGDESARYNHSHSNNPFADDYIDTHTFVSDTHTIGDLQRQGYVNRAPQFDSVRKVIFASVLLTRGIFAFPSEESYATYLEHKRKWDLVDPVTTLGLPLFHAVPSNLVKSIFASREIPVMKIYRYKVVDRADNISDYPNAAVLHEGPSYKIIRFEFCEIVKVNLDEKTDSPNLSVTESITNGELDHSIFPHYHHHHHHHNTQSHQHHHHNHHHHHHHYHTHYKVKHTLKFYNGLEYTMMNYNHRKDIDTIVDSLPLRWFGFSSFASPFGSSEFKLLVLDDNMPTYMQPSYPERVRELNAYVNSSSHSSTSALSEPVSTAKTTVVTSQVSLSSSISLSADRTAAAAAAPAGPTTTVTTTAAARDTLIRPFGYLPVWGTYNDDSTSLIPTKMAVRVASFSVKEVTEDTNGETEGGIDTKLQDLSIDGVGGGRTGILNIPWNTEVLTCMCMLLHEYESRKERRHGNLNETAGPMVINKTALPL